MHFAIMTLPQHLKIAFALSVAFNIFFLNRLQVPYVCALQEDDATLTTNDSYNSKTKSLISQMVIFVGGCPRSGTTLARVLLDAHPDIRCGEETHIIPRVFALYNWMVNLARLERQGAESPDDSETKAVFQATRAFTAKIIAGHGAPAKYLCNKDPLLLQEMKSLARMFPKSKFLLMVRDGRGVTHSIVSRNITISGVNITDYLSTALFWNKLMQTMTEDCSQLLDKCMTVFYEKLVRDPSGQMKEVLRFLDIPWHDDVLRHHELIGSEVILSK